MSERHIPVKDFLADDWAPIQTRVAAMLQARAMTIGGQTQTPQGAFVVLNNNSGLAFRKRYLGNGAARFLDKSIEFEQLAKSVAGVSQHATH